MHDAKSLAIRQGGVRSGDGTRLSYASLGKGPPLLVCHGSFAVADDWMAFARHLGATRTIYLYDRRGRALSPYVADDFAIDAEVDDLAAMAAVAGPGAAILGHSFGGGCALAFAARDAFPGPLILYEPRHSICKPVSRGHAEEVDSLVMAGNPGAAIECVLAKIVGMPPEMVANFRRSPFWDRMCATVGAFTKEVRLLDSLVWTQGELDAIAGPISLLIGEKSHAAPEEAEADTALAALLLDVRRTTIPGQGHFAYTTDPALLARIVADELATVRL
jgi:pimeloyl-ACP methyl ester carboxylesterase